MLKDLKNNDRGIVFITVLLIIIATTVFTISALSLNISHIKKTENNVKYIQAKVLAEGGLTQIFTSHLTNSPVNTVSYTETIGNTTFTIFGNIDNGTPGPGGTSPVNIDVTF